MYVNNVSNGEVLVCLDGEECNTLSHACYESIEHMRAHWDADYVKQVELMGAFFTMAFHAVKASKGDNDAR